MEDLRWSDCDEMAANDPIACLLCRTSKLNDHAHAVDNRLIVLESTLAKVSKHVNWFGLVSASFGAASAAIGLWRAVSGH